MTLNLSSSVSYLFFNLPFTLSSSLSLLSLPLSFSLSKLPHFILSISFPRCLSLLRRLSFLSACTPVPSVSPSYFLFPSHSLFLFTFPYLPYLSSPYLIYTLPSPPHLPSFLTFLKLPQSPLPSLLLHLPLLTSPPLPQPSLLTSYPHIPRSTLPLPWPIHRSQPFTSRHLFLHRNESGNVKSETEHLWKGRRERKSIPSTLPCHYLDHGTSFVCLSVVYLLVVPDEGSIDKRCRSILRLRQMLRFSQEKGLLFWLWKIIKSFYCSGWRGWGPFDVV